jgi:AcrR family transcriptional regulator
VSRTPDPEIRSRLLDAADRLLARHGFRRMTVEAVAAEAGIGKGSVYLHFESKEEVALACIDRMAEAIVARLEQLAARGGAVLPRLRAMLRARVLGRFDYARLHARSIDEKLAVMRQGLLDRRRRQFAREAGIFSVVIAAAVRSGRLRVVAPQRAGRALVEATNALLPYSLSVRELGRRALLSKRLDEVIELLLAGLARGGAAKHSRPPRIRRNA